MQQKVVTVTSFSLQKQKKCKDCRRGGRVDRWRNKGEREMEDEGEEMGDGGEWKEK
jgi:hypothetical protein